MRTYGSVEWRNGTWTITDLLPHAAIRLKHLFQGVRKVQQPPIELPKREETPMDLEWFMARYPLKISEKDQGLLAEQVRDHKSKLDRAERIFQSDYTPSAVKLNGELRHYQAVAVDLFDTVGRLLVGDWVGLGKEQPVSSKVLTPSGWSKIGDIKVGDEVIGSSGRPIKVTGVFPQGVKDVYSVSFSDGSSARCGIDHLWTFDHLCGGKRMEKITIAARDLLHGVLKNRISSQGIRTELNLHRPGLLGLPMIDGPVIFDGSEKLPIPAYTLGMLLANGSLNESSVTVTVNKQDWPEVSQRMIDDGMTLSGIEERQGCYRARLLGLKPLLKQVNLYNVLSEEKRIPRQYLLSDPENRVALLNGLMDGDGSCSKARNRVTYHSINFRLANDVADLVECLGGIATVREYNRNAECKPTEYQVRIRVPQWVGNPFYVSRKRSRFSGSGRAITPTRKFVGIKKVGSEESVCISVDAEDHLYCTDHAILTHNTITAIGCMTRAKLPAMVVMQPHLLKQWQSQVERFLGLRCHIIKTRRPYELPVADVYLMAYSRISGWTDIGKTGAFPFIVFDECQELRKEDSDKYQASKIFADAAERVLGLSATPVYNFGNEIFNVMNVIKPGALGGWGDFSREWCGYGNAVKDPKALGSYLREKHLFIRRTRQDVNLELPMRDKIVHEIGSDSKAIESVEQLAHSLAMRTMTGSFMERGQAARELDLLMRQATGIGKAAYVAEYVRIFLESGEPVLLLGWHRACYDIWLEKLKEFNPVMYTGSESPAQKEEARQRFLSGESNLMIMSLRSGVGLDGLQERCSTVIFGELDWSSKVHEQCVGRVERDGQKNKVTVIYLVSDEGSDPPMIELLALKSAQADGITDPFSAQGEVQSADDSRVKMLAQAVLNRRKR